MVPGPPRARRAGVQHPRPRSDSTAGSTCRCSAPASTPSSSGTSRSARAFPAIDGDRPVQEVLPTLAVPLPVADLSGLAPARREREAERLVRGRSRAAVRPGRADRWSPRSCFAAWRADEHLLTVVVHHIVSDGWSMGVLQGDLSRFYRAGLLRTEAGCLPALPIQYADFADWQRRASPARCWRRSSPTGGRGWPACRTSTSAATDRARRCRPSAALTRTSACQPIWRSGWKSWRAGREPRSSWFCSPASSSPPALGAAGRLRRRRAGGEPNRAEIEDLIGPFINNLPLRADLTGDPTVRELLARSALPRSPLTRTRICRSKSSWKSCGRSATRAAARWCRPASISSTSRPCARSCPGSRSTAPACAASARTSTSPSGWPPDRTAFRLAGAQRRPLRPSDRPAHGRPPRAAPRRHGGKHGAADRGSSLAGRSRAGPGPARLEPHGPAAARGAFFTALFHEQAARTPDAIAVLHDGCGLTHRSLTGGRAPGRAAWTSAEWRPCARRDPGRARARFPDGRPRGAGSRRAAPGCRSIRSSRRGACSQFSGRAARRCCSPEKAVARSSWPARKDLFQRSWSLTIPTGRRAAFLVLRQGPDDLAYVIFTSGSTGVPKGVP